MTTPPTFDQFYNSQGDVHMPSQQNSFDQYTANAFASTSEQQFGAIYAQQLGDEPASLGVDESAHSLQHRLSQESLRPNQFAMGDPRANVERKDSVPFDPTSSSTLIASASNTPSKFMQHHQQQQQQFNQFDGNDQFAYTQHTPLAGLSPQPSDMVSPPQQPDFGFQSQGFYQEPQGLNATETPQSNLEWSGTTDFLNHNGGADANADSRRASWGGSSQHLGYDEQIDELQKIISNASSQAGTPAPGSRVASPFMPPEHQGFGHARHDSTSSVARSPSPFAATTPSMASPSPPVMHTNSNHGSPSFSKPQSPPALIIPNTTPASSFPSIAATTAASQRAAQQGSSSQFGNSLLPPVNPALEHLTGMAGISPIAPNADGPMITIQPSTPISGMKEHAGVFDAALRRASWQQHNQQQGQQQQPQQSTTQPQSHVGSPQPQSNGMPSPNLGGTQTAAQDNAVFVSDTQWSSVNFGGLDVDQGPMRTRSKSESYMADGGAFDRQAAAQLMSGPMGQFFSQQSQQGMNMDNGTADPWGNINAWRADQARESGQMTMDPRNLSGSEVASIQDQMRTIEAQQRARLQHINTTTSSTGVFKYEPGQISPTSAAFYAQLNAQTQSSLMAPSPGLGARRRSFNDYTHPAAGAGTPGYGVEFSMPGAITPPGRLRGGSFNMGHRRQAHSEDFGRGGLPGTGWGVGQGGSTAAFMQAMTTTEGHLLPPMNRGRSMHSRNSSASSVHSGRSPSPALSISSQGSSFSHHSHMDMPDGVPPELFMGGESSGSRGIAKMKVTSLATEVASQSRRTTNSGIFKCPVPGCGSTFTRHFNLKGHMRSHNNERPYKCLYEGCPKAEEGFARQHDCKRHMLLHEGLRPFECEGCGKKFARLDALTRHHKSEQGQECAISHPLPTNPDGSAMSESQYKAYRLQQMKERGGASAGGSSRGGRRSGGLSADVSADERDLVKTEG